jgi:hypothetical protein
MPSVVKIFLCHICGLVCLAVLNYPLAFTAHHTQDQLTAIVGGTRTDRMGGEPLPDSFIVIEGENFLDSSTVEVNGTLVAARPVPGSLAHGTMYLPHYSQMKVTIPATLLTQAGTFPLTVTNPQPEGGTSSYSSPRHR